ncbi:hypothetical protein D030_3854A, partial [Vibrio parahaemolyticus AQ3810]
MPAIKAA